MRTKASKTNTTALEFTVSIGSQKGMLSIEECRNILQEENMTDEQITEVREILYNIAHHIIDIHPYLPFNEA